MSDEVEGDFLMELGALFIFLMTMPFWFPFWLISKLKNRKNVCNGSQCGGRCGS